MNALLIRFISVDYIGVVNVRSVCLLCCDDQTSLAINHHFVPHSRTDSKGLLRPKDGRMGFCQSRFMACVYVLIHVIS